MTSPSELRVMWLLNHRTAREFEIPMMKRIGIEQIFLPKSFPHDPSFRSADLEFSEDQFLHIAEAELRILNTADWYRGASPDAWSIANKYFDLIFFVLHEPEVLSNAARYFNGAVVWRAYGLDISQSYGRLVTHFNQFGSVNRLGPRFYLGEAYPQLADSEPDYLKARRVYLPVGMPDRSPLDAWEGKERRIYFVCPDIGLNPYYRAIYEEFRGAFIGMDYVIAGPQPIHVNDPKVLGYVASAQHARNMAQSRVMFYHSQEPHHIHYHPFEAIRAGMPLVFMAGGMLDRMGGIRQPGRCKSVAEAKRKIERILNDDWRLIERIRQSQTALLEPMKPENCEPAWRDGLAGIASNLAAWRSEQAGRRGPSRHKRVAVILPIDYRGGTLRGALTLAMAIRQGSRQCGESADVVFVHPDDRANRPDGELAVLPDPIAIRSFNWRVLTAAEARRAMRYAGFQDWEPTSERYMVPDDGAQQLLDCDVWLIVSDRLSHPLLPLKPVVLMVYDYLRRYEEVLPSSAEMPFLSAARSAQRVLVTTEFTRRDALQYAGVDPRKITKLPILAPVFPIVRAAATNGRGHHAYFIWTTNAALHKNHRNAAEALRIYYDELDGQWECMVTGADTAEMLASSLPHLKAMAGVFERSGALRRRVKWRGYLSDAGYRRVLSHAGFLWHAARIDNGTFSVIEAACSGVPSLSSDYPAMREIDAQFSLNLAWMNPESPPNMAERLKWMELEASARRDGLPGEAQLRAQGVETHAKAYWEEVRACL